MKNLTSIIICLFASVSLFAQDPKAKEILDKLSKQTKTYNSIEAEFDYKMINKGEGINEVQHGTLITKGEKYYFDIAGQQIFSDGTTMWTLLEDAGEIQINEVPDESEMEEDYLSPTNILTLWEKGFKYKYDKETTLNGSAVNIVNLYPEEPEEKTFHTIQLFVDKNKNEMKQIIIKGKDGTDFIYVINNFKPNQPINESKFTFNKKDHPNIDVIDLR